MKKISIISLILIAFTAFAVIVLNSNPSNNVLYLLNWGEYINEDLVAEFETKFDVQVVEEVVTSSETMYQKISAGTTSYDVAIPGDYMVTKLQEDGYLNKLDVKNSKYENLSNYENLFVDDINTLRNKFMKDSLEYSMPYFWGAYSIIYNNNNSKTESVVNDYGFKALFDRSLYDVNPKVGMYSTARWAISSYLLGENLDPNKEDIDQKLISNELKKASFDVWGDDQLKRKVANGDLDLTFTQLGDFFDVLYLSLNEGMGSGRTGKEILDSITFNAHVPTHTAAFFDAMVIPKTSKNEELANEFINFMLDKDNAFENALQVGYCPTLKETVELFKTSDEVYYESDDSSRVITIKEFVEKYPIYLNPLINNNIDEIYLLEPKSSEYMTMCETIVNQAKSQVEAGSKLGTYLAVGTLSLVVITACYFTTSYFIKKKKHGSK